MKTSWCGLSFLVLTAFGPGSLIHADDGPLSQYYGFRPIEVFKLSERSSNLLSGDLNHDGLADLILVDNSHSRLDLLIQRKGAPKNQDRPLGRSDVNAVEDHWRFEHRKLPVDREVAALTLGDFNGDGRVDMAYFGTPDQLIIRFQPLQGEWTEKTQQRVPDAAPAPWCMTAGDLDSNGLDDLVILGKHETIVFYQLTKGTLAPPKKMMNTSDKLGLAQIADLDGDGRNDLCYLAGEGLTRALGTRLQLPDGQLGPEYIFDLERPRSVTLRDVDGKPGQEIMTIDSRTGRVKMMQVERRKPDADSLPERLIQFGFGKQGSGRDRDLTIEDVDGDGLNDVVVTDPDASRVLLFRQRAGSGLDLGTPFPGLSGADQIRSADFDGDGKAELVIHSGAEKTVGVSRFIDGKLAFPESLPVEGDTSGLELTDLDGDGKPEVMLVARTKKDRSSEYSLQALKRATKDDWQPYLFGGKNSVVIDVKGTPELLMQVDITGDKRPEFLVFQGSKPPQLFGLNADGVPVEISTTGNLGLGAVSPGAVSQARLDGKPGLLVAQENFARHMLLGANHRWQVDEQINAGESNSKIVGATLIDLDSKPGPEIALVDAGVKKLRVFRKADSGFVAWKELDIGEFAFKSLRVADLNGDKREDLLLFGADKLAVLYAGAAAPALKELASFESQLDKIYPTDIIAGDFNGDGKVDLAMTDTRSHFLELLQYRPESGLQHALYFRIFEQKSFRNEEEGGGTDPREGLAVDVTGDGLQDLLLLMHDRLILYPQDDGRQ
ncbi:MAG: VCBS repeat-containing protein [Planctomycetes bacterium]|nr:VCBS repeat-containing protein [Planctomycetota bacterium]